MQIRDLYFCRIPKLVTVLSVRINPQHSDCISHHTPHKAISHLSSQVQRMSCKMHILKKILKTSLIWSVFNLLKTDFKLNETERVWSHCAVTAPRVGYTNCQLILYSHVTAVGLMRDTPSPCLGRRGGPEKVRVNKKCVNQNDKPSTIKRLT
jgi:hypothetical protein